MAETLPHSMLPRANHDELAGQQFVQAMKVHVSSKITSGNHKIYEQVARPKFEKEKKRPPSSRHEVRHLMEDEPYHQMWGSLMRLGQELMWDTVIESVDRQLEDLIARSRPKGARGSLTLNPTLKQPRYLAAVDQHGQPGSYYTDTCNEDVRAGAILDRGASIYHFGGAGGIGMEGRGRTLLQFLFEKYPDLDPKTIVDIGCSVGASTVPLAQFYPNAKVYGVDTGAPLLRYAHGRAEALGVPVHYAQQSGENLEFPDESVDLVVSLVVLHETSTKALPRIMSECYRVLKPGGVVAHLEVPVRYAHMPNLMEQTLRDWQTYYNDEPFWGRVCETDLIGALGNAGFDDVYEGFQKQTIDPRRGATGFTKVADSRPGHWYVAAGTKS
jgi:ubiquinone/menaquinone biosynthesis C-methylase UbiE